MSKTIKELTESLNELEEKYLELEKKVKGLEEISSITYNNCPECNSDLEVDLRVANLSSPPTYVVRCTSPNCNYSELITGDEVKFIKYKKSE